MNRHPMKRAGLTLVEMLIAITVLAILSGMLMAGLFPMLNRAKEAAIVTEMKQIESAIEQFQIEYGFYPPSFKQFNNPALSNTERINLITRYVNRISPNHSENVANWWTNVGSTIREDNGEDLVFWLSGLFKNKQYPLTNDGNPGKPAYDNGTPNRKVFFEFAADRIQVNGLAASFNQDSSAPSPFIYIDSASYQVNTGVNPGACLNPAGVAYNLKTFQLSAPGLDKTFGNSAADRRVNKLPLEDHDNICNFAGGRIDTFLNSIAE